MPMETRYAMGENGSVAYQTVGGGELDLVFVPCWVSHLDHLWEEPRFVRFVQRLSAFGRVILFDRRGTGLSDPAISSQPETLSDRLDDLRAVLDAAGSHRAVLVGVSAGCPLAARFAAEFPNRIAALVMVGGAARRLAAPDYPLGMTQEQLAGFLNRVAQEWGGPFEIESFAPSLAHDPKFRDWWAGYLRRAASPFEAVEAARHCAETDVRDSLSSVQAPTLVLHRTGDRVIGVAQGRDLARRIPDAHFVELPGADHIPFLGDQERLFGEVAAFLSQRGVTPRSRSESTVATLVVVRLTSRDRGFHHDNSRAAEPLTDLESLLDHDFLRHGGCSMNVAGDELVAVVDTPARAVSFAEHLQDRAGSMRWRRSIGIHTGPVDIIEHAVSGLARSIAARIARAAGPGEVLVSRTARLLAFGSGLTFVAIANRDQPGCLCGGPLYRYEPHPDAHASADTLIAAPERVTDQPTIALSPREREVSVLLAAGQTNKEIAVQLAISIGTIERHVTNILTKLGLRSRTQVAAWAAERRITAEQSPAPIPAFSTAGTLRPAA